jgi:hypothetical protein
MRAGCATTSRAVRRPAAGGPTPAAGERRVPRALPGASRGHGGPARRAGPGRGADAAQPPAVAGGAVPAVLRRRRFVQTGGSIVMAAAFAGLWLIPGTTSTTLRFLLRFGAAAGKLGAFIGTYALTSLHPVIGLGRTSGIAAAVCLTGALVTAALLPESGVAASRSSPSPGRDFLLPHGGGQRPGRRYVRGNRRGGLRKLIVGSSVRLPARRASRHRTRGVYGTGGVPGRQRHPCAGGKSGARGMVRGTNCCWPVPLVQVETDSWPV